MLNFSFSTVLMALLTSSILVGLIAIIFLHNNTLVCAGYKLLGIFVGLAVIRLIVPLEFPFTMNIRLAPMLSKIIALIRKPQIPILNATVSIWNIFVIIWVAGILFNLVRYIKQYYHAQDYILKYGRNRTKDIRYKTILDSICVQQKRKNSFRVMELPNMNIPIIYGLKNPYIILPDNLSISEEQLYYVLYHEAMHHFHHDFFIKCIIRFFSIVYWWNPAFTILYRQTNTLLEMHIDEIITHKEVYITEKYAECLLYMKKNSINHSSQQMFDFLKRESCLLVQSQDKDFKRRLIMLLQDFAMPKKMIDSCICLYFSPQFHMLHTERCSARRKTGCHHPWKLRFLWLCSHGLRYTGRPVYSSYSFHTSYLFSFLPCLVSTGGAVPVDAFSGVSAIRHSPPHHNPGCALHHILAPQCPNHIQ